MVETPDQDEILCDISRLFVFLRHFTVVFDLFLDFFQIVGNLDKRKVSGISVIVSSGG